MKKARGFISEKHRDRTVLKMKRNKTPQQTQTTKHKPLNPSQIFILI